MQDKKQARLVKSLIDSTRITPKGLISTIYGDSLVPHGGTVWLTSIVNLAKPFGVAEYLGRTSALRLVHDGWLHPTRIGKLSFYSMTDEHIRRMKDHYPRVYNPPVRAWSGVWHLLMTGATELPRKKLLELRQNFSWHGVGQIAPHVYISAAEGLDAIELLLRELDLQSHVQVMRAEAVLPKDDGLLRSLVLKAWDIGSIAGRYEAFLKKYRPAWMALEDVTLEPEAAFIIRTLLIHDYRTIVVQDPRLPQDFLPEPWAGHQAFTLCKNLYQMVLAASEAYLKLMVRTADGPISDPGELLYSRFGGLQREEIPAAPEFLEADLPKLRRARAAAR